MKRFILPSCLLALAAVSGCGDSDVNLVKVSGTITRNGKPYEGALVEFMPDRSNPAATIGTDVTGPDGNYLIKSASGRTGLAPGKYSVKVSKAPTASSTDFASVDQGPTPENDPGQLAAANFSMTRKGPRKDDGANGSFHGEVAAAGSVLDFDVKIASKMVSK